MSYRKTKLSHQLFLLVAIIFVLLFISLGVVLPQMLIPVAEENIYNYLKEPLKFMNSDVDKSLLNTEIAYLYVVDDNIIFSDNIDQVIRIKNKKLLLNKIKNKYGKFIYNHNTFYYYMINSNGNIRVAISDNEYINKTKESILKRVFPIVLTTCLIIGFMLVIWATIVVNKVERLKQKIDNIDNDDYNHKIDFMIDDEIKSLAFAIEDMRLSLINQERYRNQMYQNISHDFKTPLTVIKSYIEAVEDDVEDEKTALNIIKQQSNKLEQKVHSLLYLNKLDYLRESNKNIQKELIDMKKIVESEVEKFKFHRKEVKFVTSFDRKIKFYGTVENWETILDNLLSNFIRYANTTIKITVKLNKLILYNDGDNIDNDFLEGIFTPFRKGIKGEFGLGLSIVKKTLNLMNYDISIKNEKRGVSFIIKEIHK